MKKFFLSLCSASMATLAVAATAVITPEQLRVSPKGDFTVCPVLNNTTAIHKAPSRTAEAAESMETFDYTPAYIGYLEAYGLGQQVVGYEIVQSVVISPEFATHYAGATVKSINFYTPRTQAGPNPINSANLYIFDKIGGNTLLTQEATLGEDGEVYTEYTLNEPYVIKEGEGFAVGFGVTPTSANDYYIYADALYTGNNDAGYIALRQGGVLDWQNFASQVGSLYIGITLEAESFPKNEMGVIYMQAPNNVPINTPFTAQIIVTGESNNPVENFEIEYTVGDGTTQTVTWSTPEPFGFHELVGGEIENLVCNGIGEQNFTFTVTKVNGQPNTAVNSTYSIKVNGIDPNVGYTRNFVVEEGTGTWCGFCPAGIVFMETMKDQYPEVIRVAVHYNDEMQVSSGSALLQMYTGYPQVYVNRALMITPSEADTYEVFDAYFNEYEQIPALMEVTDLTIEKLSERQMQIKAKARFAIDVENDERYGIAFSITQDDMGPYAQTNYYAGNRYGVMGGWEKKGSAVPTIYEDVLRVYTGGLSGYTEIFPAQIKAEQEYEFETNVYVSSITSEDFLLNALIIDNTTGEIVNAKQVAATKSAVKGVSEANAERIAEEYYNLNGIRVEEPAQGIFIKRIMFSDGTEQHVKVVL